MIDSVIFLLKCLCWVHLLLLLNIGHPDQLFHTEGGQERASMCDWSFVLLRCVCACCHWCCGNSIWCWAWWICFRLCGDFVWVICLVCGCCAWSCVVSAASWGLSNLDWTTPDYQITPHRHDTENIWLQNKSSEYLSCINRVLFFVLGNFIGEIKFKGCYWFYVPSAAAAQSKFLRSGLIQKVKIDIIKVVKKTGAQQETTSIMWKVLLSEILHLETNTETSGSQIKMH